MYILSRSAALFARQTSPCPAGQKRGVEGRQKEKEILAALDHNNIPVAILPLGQETTR